MQTRIPVAQPIHEPVTGVACGPLPVGVVRWPGDRITIVVKATLSYARAALTPSPGGAAIEAAVIAAEQEPLSLGRPSALPGAGPDELAYPSDFVLWRSQADVLLHGHAHADRAADAIDARLGVAGGAGAAGRPLLHRRFIVVGPPAERLPLSRAALRDPGGAGPADPVGPIGPLPVEEAAEDDLESTVALDDDEADDSAGPPPDDEFGPYLDIDAPIAHEGLSFAAPAQRCAPIPASAVLDLAGLSPGGGRRFVQLPGLRPRVLLETPWGDRPVALACDTLWIDTDDERIVLVWRGQALVTRKGRDVQRIAVWLERDDAPRSREDRRRALLRGTTAPAIEREDLTAPAPPEDDPTLIMEEYARWVEPVEPSLPLERYAAIGAELAEQRAPRREVLERHRLSEDDWTLEERAWLEKMGDAAMQGDEALAIRYGALFVAAQDALAGPGELERTLEDYVNLKAAMDAGDRARVLADVPMSVAAWTRLERRWTREAIGSSGVREEMARLLRAARIREAKGGGGT